MKLKPHKYKYLVGTPVFRSECHKVRCSEKSNKKAPAWVLKFNSPKNGENLMKLKPHKYKYLVGTP